MEEEKLFMWYDSGGRDHRYPYPILGPYMSYDNKLIGEKYYHTLEDLLKIYLSDSIKKKLMSAKIGTKIKIMRLHSSGDLMVMRIDDTQREYLDKLAKVINEKMELNKKVWILEKDVENIVDILFPISQRI